MMMPARRKTSSGAFDAGEYLKRPYGRLLTPENDGTFRAEIREFPGCLATGDTPEEALSALEDAALNWLEASHQIGLAIPEPAGTIEYSGKFVVRLPKTLHKKAAFAAEQDGVSLNTFVVNAIAELIGGGTPKRSNIPPTHVIFVQQAPSQRGQMPQSIYWQPPGFGETLKVLAHAQIKVSTAGNGNNE